MSRLPKFDAARTISSGTITGSYKDLGGTMDSPVYAFVIYNTMDADVQVSFDDGSTDGPIIPSGEKFRSEKKPQVFKQEDMTFVLPKGAQVQTKQVTTASSGNVILNVMRE